MLSDSSVLTEEFEVCVIGAGPVGIAVALTLGRSGVKTLLLERGLQHPKPPKADRNRSRTITDDLHASDRDTLAVGLGGTSSRWGGRCVELDDIDFEHRDFVADAQWPIAHGNLKPFYVEAAQILRAPAESGVDHGEAFIGSRESWAFPRNTAIANRADLSSSSALHILLDAQVAALNFDNASSRVSSVAIFRRGQQFKVIAKRFVLACGGRENARILLNLQARFPQLFGGEGGPLGQFYMGHLTGQIAQIRFRSHAVAEEYFFKRQAQSRFTRVRFQPRAELQQSLGVLNSVMWPHNSDIGKLPPSNPIASAAFFREVINGKRQASTRDCVAHGLCLVRHPIKALTSSASIIYDRLYAGLPHLLIPDANNEYALSYHAEQMPRAQSCVRLTAQRDQYGELLVEPVFSYCQEDFRSVVRTHHALDRWLRTAALGSLDFFKGDPEELVAQQARDGYHQIGLTRMGSNRRNGVVDGNCRTYDVQNLFVAGSSVFTTSGQANPTLPAVAFGVRLARHLAAFSKQRAVAVDMA